MVKKENKQNKSNEKLCAILSYLIIGIVWFFVDNNIKKSSFVKFHVKQALILIIADVIIWVIAGIPIMGLIASTVLWVGFLILWIIGIINASNEKTEEIPIIGKFAEKFTF